MIEIYTDGSCLKASNKEGSGPGGIGILIIFPSHEITYSQGYIKSTNNRMEIMACIKALELIGNTTDDIIIYTDSEYVKNAIEKQWISKWQKNGWKTSTKKPVKNKDLWIKLMELKDKHNVKFQWVKAHSTNVNNNRCDQMAQIAAKGNNKLRDEGFETNN